MKTITILHDNYIDNLYKDFFSKLADDVKWVSLNQLKKLKSSDNIKEFLDIINEASLCLFTGGSDVDPKLYGENIGKYTSVSEIRDKDENILFGYLPYTMLKVGICRGSQFLTVMNGGSLIQHVEGHGMPHDISIKSNEITLKGRADIIKNYRITSTHHQMMYPFNLRKSEYDIIAWSRRFLSNVYLNGNNEQKDIPEKFVEPEIVFYKNSRSLCIQGHPEYDSCPSTTKDVCLKLIKKYLYEKN